MSNLMLRHAMIMADRLSVARSVRPTVFISDSPKEMTAVLLLIGEELSSRGSEFEIADGYQTGELFNRTALVQTPGPGSIRLMLIPDINLLQTGALAKLLDDLHLAARDGLSASVIATGPPAIRKRVGNLRSFGERLFEFRRAETATHF